MASTAEARGRLAIGPLPATHAHAVSHARGSSRCSAGQKESAIGAGTPKSINSGSGNLDSDGKRILEEFWAIRSANARIEETLQTLTVGQQDIGASIAELRRDVSSPGRGGGVASAIAASTTADDTQGQQAPGDESASRRSRSVERCNVRWATVKGSRLAIEAPASALADADMKSDGTARDNSCTAVGRSMSLRSVGSGGLGTATNLRGRGGAVVAQSSQEVRPCRSTATSVTASGRDERAMSPEDSGDADGSTAFVASTLPLGWPQVLKVRAKPHRHSSQVIIAHSNTSSRRFSFRKSSGSLAQSSVSIINTLEESSDPSQDSKWCCGLIDPSSKFHMGYSILSLVVLLFDLTLLPFVLAWDLEIKGLLYIASWCTPIFWSVDILINFCTAFYRGGDLVTDRRKIARNYVKSWLTPDATVVICDWLSVIVAEVSNGESGDGSRGLKMLRFAKLGRLLRIIGMVRMLRVVRILEELAQMHLTDGGRLAFRMLTLFIGILWVAHILACLWYAIGVAGPSDTGERWTDQASVFVDGNIISFVDANDVYQYMVSLHWATGQISLGALDVMPTNSTERAVFVVTMMCGFLFGSTLVSTLSAAMIDFQMNQKDKTSKLRTLRQYLRENNVTPNIALLVQKQAEQRLSQRETLNEKDVAALQLLSMELRHQLQFEIQKPHLSKHAIFRLWFSLDWQLMRKVCSQAISVLNLRPKDDLFGPASQSESAWTLIQGQMHYTQYPDSSPVESEDVQQISPGKWISEAALWVEWTHVGKLEASGSADSACQLLEVNTEALASCLRGDLIILDMSVDYGRQFHKRVTSAHPPFAPWPTDLEVPFTDFCDLVVSMSTHLQVTVGLDALKVLSRQGVRVMRTLEKLEQEVRASKSILVVTGCGDVIRVVSLVVLRAERPDGCVLAQVGKWEDGKDIKGNCQLPGAKQEGDETFHETFDRILSSKLCMLKGKLEFAETTRDDQEKESKEFKLYTRYLRAVRNARLKDGEELAAPVCARRSRMGSPTSLGSAHSSGSLGGGMNPTTSSGRGFSMQGLSSERENGGDGHENSLTLRDGFSQAIMHSLHGVEVFAAANSLSAATFYAWLPSTVLHTLLNSPSADDILTSWLSDVIIPEGLFVDFEINEDATVEEEGEDCEDEELEDPYDAPRFI